MNLKCVTCVTGKNIILFLKENETLQNAALHNNLAHFRICVFPSSGFFFFFVCLMVHESVPSTSNTQLLAQSGAP